MEILSQLPHFLDNLDDLYALLSTSRLFYQACAGTPAKLPLGPKTDKRLILAGTSRQIADWTSEDPANRSQLWNAMEEGSRGLLKLARDVAPFRLDEMRTLHEAKKTIINPLVAKMQADCLECEKGKFYKNHCLDVTTALYDYVTYCELFHHDVASKVYDESAELLLGRDIRLQWVSKCLCDVTYKGSRRSVARNRRLRNLFNIYQGPYHRIEAKIPLMRMAMSNTVLGSAIAWHGIKFSLYSQLMQHRGLDTLKMLLNEGFSTPEIRHDITSELMAFLNNDKDDQAMKDQALHARDDWHSLACDLATVGPFL